jgi:hypothetical protein
LLVLSPCNHVTTELFPLQFKFEHLGATTTYQWYFGSQAHRTEVTAKALAVNRTELLTAALSKLSDAVALLSDAGEEKLAAHLEDIIHQVELSLVEDETPPK